MTSFKSLILLAALMAIAVSIQVSPYSWNPAAVGHPAEDVVVSPSADGKVNIDFYYESLCPYCQQFMEGALKVAANTKDFWKICNFNLYPYGNARRTQSSTGWTFTCQHGPSECVGNLIETCALGKYDLYTQALPFIICLQGSTNDWVASGKRCATQLNLDWNLIYSCSTSSEGNTLQYQMAVKTESLVPAHQYVPWVVVNGQHSQQAESAVQTNMVKYVCSMYTGPEKIAACGK